MKADDPQLAACFSGLAAGILGLTNIPGFLLYLITAVLCAGINAALKCGFDVAKYVPQAHSGGGQGQAVSSGKISVWKGYLALSGLGQEGLLGFLLFWIGGYALIHGTCIPAEVVVRWYRSHSCTSSMQVFRDSGGRGREQGPR